jgi:hypothetical protein
MKPWIKGIVIAAIHVGLVASLGAKLLYDRRTRPHVWTLAAPYDPNLPIRGRYVSLQPVVELKGIDAKEGEQTAATVVLGVAGDRLVAEAAPPESSDLRVQFIRRGDQRLAVLREPLAFFIPEHVPDPSRRPPDEELWVEVTVPAKGPPRPIRLGVKKGDGPIVPLRIE